MTQSALEQIERHAAEAVAAELERTMIASVLASTAAGRQIGAHDRMA